MDILFLLYILFFIFLLTY